MFRRVVIILCCCWSLTCFSQTAGKDSSRVNSYLLLGQQYFGQDIQLAQQYCDSAMALASVLNDPKGLARATNMRGIFSLVQGKFEEALYDLRRTAKYNLDIENYAGAASSIANMGSVYKDMGDYPKALEHYIFAGKIFENNNSLLDQAINFNSIAEIHYQQSNYDKALDYYQKALTINMNLGDQGYGFVGINLGNIGMVQAKQNQYEQALENYEKALTIFEDIGDIRRKAECQSNMAGVYMDLGEHRTANELLNESKEVFEMMNYQLRVGDVLNRIGDTEFAMGNYSKSNELYLEALSNATNIQAKNLILDAYEDLQKLNFTIGDFELAYQYSDSAKIMRDSIFNETKSEQIAQIEGEYQYDKQQQKISKEKQERLNSEIKAETRLLWIGLLVVLLVGFIFITILYVRSRKAKERARISNLKHQALRAQMNPHFTFNILNSIQNLILLNKPEEATEYLSEFAVFLRNTLEYSNQTTISLKQELNFTEVYLELEKVRFKDNLTYNFELSDNLDYEKIKVPSLFIQPFVENAIVHGFGGDQKGEVTLSVKLLEPTLLEINVLDNGQGLGSKIKEEKEKESLGIKISQERLWRMDERNTITLQNREGISGVHVRILIHLS